MGRHLLSVTGLAHKVIADLKPLAEMLAPNERRVVEQCFEIILQQRVAIANATELMPLEAALVVLHVEERIQNDHELNELYQQIEKLHKRIRELEEEKERLEADS